MPRNAENSDFYRFVARNPLLASLFKTKKPKCGRNGAEQQDRTIRPPAGGRWREAPEGGPHPGNHPICRYTLHPRTGKTHQLRVHMNSLGLPIVGDDFYPRIQTRPYDDFSQPLQLVARVLRFTDPITGEKREFVSRVPLKI